MCVAIPGRVIAIGVVAGLSIPALVTYGSGPTREVDLVMVPDVDVGDYVIVHSGFAISRISKEEAAQTLQLIADSETRSVQRKGK